MNFGDAIEKSKIWLSSQNKMLIEDNELFDDNDLTENDLVVR